MNTETLFNKNLIDYLDDIKSSKGIIVPNKFNIYKTDCNKLVSKLGNKSIIISNIIHRDFTTIGNYVWGILSKERKYLLYAIVGYIAQSIKFNSNIIRITPERIKGYVLSEINNRDFYNAINFLKAYNVIGDCKIKSCYVVNPIAIYKGDIYKFVEVCEQAGFVEAIKDNDDKLIIDKYAIIKDTFLKDIEVVLNKTYYTNKIDNNIIENKNNKEKMIEAQYSFNVRQ